MSFFGTSGGPTRWYRNATRNNYQSYLDSINEAWGMDAGKRYRSGLNAYTTNALDKQSAVGYGNLGSRGFAASSPNLFSLARATMLGKGAADWQTMAAQGKMQGYSGAGDMLQGMAGSEITQPSGGTFGNLINIAGAVLPYLGQLKLAKAYAAQNGG